MQSKKICHPAGALITRFFYFYKYFAPPELDNNISKREKLIKMIGFFYARFLACNHISFIDSTLTTS
jgi:hypothetical protein